LAERLYCDVARRDGWKVRLLIAASTKIPLAVKVEKIHEHEALWTRALVTHARMSLAGVARLQKVICDQGCLDGTTLWWPDQHAVTCVVLAKADMTITADSRTQAAAGEEITMSHRAQVCAMGRAKQPAPHGWRPRFSGSRGLTTDD
jgi:hypothetical protein